MVSNMQAKESSVLLGSVTSIKASASTAMPMVSPGTLNKKQSEEISAVIQP
ncbi:MAG: hypothetical protein VXZ70_05905 [Pseudomonadota bacterium]|nr:hypothetical protein [Pseudomonadota bacterium]